MEAQTTDSSDIVFKLLGWLHANRKPVTVVAVVVAVVGIAAGLYSWKQGQNDIDADAALLSLPVGNDLRIHASGDKLQELASEYPSTPAGEYAALLGGENLFVSGNFVEAERAFSKFLTDYPASALVAEAGLGVAASLEAQNKLPEATQQYQKVIQDNPTDLSVVEPAKLTLGRIDEEQNRLDLAFNQYRDLAQSPNPNDLWAGEAKERLQLLVGTHPELLKQIMAQNASPITAAPRTIPTLSAGPATTLSTSPAGNNSAPQTSQLPATAPASAAPAAH
jgi:predicted negative regulator of RcsB-dependent stress response